MTILALIGLSSMYRLTVKKYWSVSTKDALKRPSHKVPDRRYRLLKWRA